MYLANGSFVNQSPSSDLLASNAQHFPILIEGFKAKNNKSKGSSKSTKSNKGNKSLPPPIDLPVAPNVYQLLTKDKSAVVAVVKNVANPQQQRHVKMTLSHYKFQG